MLSVDNIVVVLMYVQNFMLKKQLASINFSADSLSCFDRTNIVLAYV